MQSCARMHNDAQFSAIPGLRTMSCGDINGRNSHFSCLASSISSGTARMLTNPFLKTTKTRFAPHLRAEVAQSKAVSPAPRVEIKYRLITFFCHNRNFNLRV